MLEFLQSKAFYDLDSAIDISSEQLEMCCDGLSKDMHFCLLETFNGIACELSLSCVLRLPGSALPA